MSNLRIGYLNRADSATLTASPVADTTKPVTYLQNDSRSQLFGATSTASQSIYGTWGGTAYTISQFALWRHNLVYSDTIRLYLYSDAAWTTNVYDSTALAAYTSGLFDDWGWAFTNRYITPVTGVKSFKTTVAASAAALTAARLYLGPYTEAEYQVGEGSQLGYQGNSTQSRLDGGSLAVDVRAKWRSMSIEMLVDTEAQRAAWAEIARYCMNEKTIVCTPYPGVGGTSERDMTIMGKFSENPMQKLAYNRYDFSLKLNEL